MKANIGFLLSALILVLLPEAARADSLANAYRSSVEEVGAVLTHPLVVQRMQGAGAIRSIQHDGPFYTIFAGECALRVEVRYAGPPVPGGPLYREILVSYPDCLPGGVSIGN